MRKYQKKEVEKFIELFYKAHGKIKKSIETKKPEQAMALLGQCQEAAIKIGTLIEGAEGERFVTIGLIEQYCEVLYQIHEALGKGEALSANKAHKMLHKQLIRIENSIKDDIPIHIESVFLPYKASMWDSLESVWQAADEDENCNAYVIPIPYYDRNPDGSFGKMHYEGEMFPEYVPIMYYEDYNLEEHRPDMIYIHNPYDGQNLVTSVHPAFYSEQLKKYTDCLVYIPYFVLGEILPTNQRAINGMKHFCTVPGVYNADKVVVQSEDMRQIYINVLTAQMGERSRSYWNDKILGVGSPKFDSIQMGTEMEQDIPKEWMKIIQKPDGSRKKIVFYNTSVGALLSYGTDMLKKMLEVFQIFKAHKNEVALLWRPHPLLEATVRSMRPQLWEQYQKLREDYCRDDWGIYDDSADIDRAISLCDAYYGDASSVVQLCQSIGLETMIQSC